MSLPVSYLYTWYCVKSLVQASFKSLKYPVQVMILRDTGKIILGTCGCKASALDRCSHVTALLYALEDFVKKFGRNNIPRTSKACTWNQGRKSKNPVVVGERQYSEKRVQKTKKDFGPRRPDTVCEGKESKLKITRLLNRMKCITYENQLSTGIFSPSAWEISLKETFIIYIYIYI